LNALTATLEALALPQQPLRLGVCTAWKADQGLLQVLMALSVRVSDAGLTAAGLVHSAVTL